MKSRPTPVRQPSPIFGNRPPGWGDILGLFVSTTVIAMLPAFGLIYVISQLLSHGLWDVLGVLLGTVVVLTLIWRWLCRDV